ncbi:MAG: hypothetical protein Athens071424_74 [Parcubacteria group bacterium Athens0714_24]|nr:MAG: hypothetical protein Athens071424_74 [Parcubacteria group bacterium Athens0714_24]
MIKRNFLLIIILFFALAIRLWGISYNLPLSTDIDDEIVVLAGSLRMMAENSLIISSSHGSYFPLSYYIYIPFLLVSILYIKFFTPLNTFAQIKELGLLHTGQFLIVGRLISALFGVLSVFLIYLIAEKLFKNKRISLLSSLILSISPLNILMSHFARVWTIQVFFMLLAVYFALKFFSKTALEMTTKQAVFLGSLVGLSFFSNIVGLLIFVPVLVLAGHSFEKDRFKNFILFLKTKSFIFFCATISIFISLAYFLNRTSFSNFLVFFLSNTVERNNVFSVSLWGKFFYYPNTIFKYETVLFLLVLPALYLLFKRDKKNFYFLLSGFLTFYLFLGPLGGFVQTRFSLLMIPFLVLAMAYFVDYIWRFKKTVFTIFILIIVVLPGSFLSFKLDKTLARGGANIAAYNWLLENVPDGSKILFINNYFLQDLFLTKESIAKIQKYSPEFYSSRMAYLSSLPGEKYPRPAYDVYQASMLCEWPEEEIKKTKFDYIFASEGVLKEISGQDKISLCNRREINLKDFSKIYESFGETSYDSYYTSQGEDKILKSLEYFYGVENLDPKIFIYRRQ